MRKYELTKKYTVRCNRTAEVRGSIPRSSTKSLHGKFIKDEKGAAAIEYGLIASLISVAAIVAFTSVGSKPSRTFG